MQHWALCESMMMSEPPKMTSCCVQAEHAAGLVADTVGTAVVPRRAGAVVAVLLLVLLRLGQMLVDMRVG
jgi:hypothetical protein